MFSIPCANRTSGSSTGSNRRLWEIIDDKIHLMSFTVTIDQQRTYIKEDPVYKKCNKYQELHVEVYF